MDKAIDHCDLCHGPVIPRTRFALVRDSLLYDLWLMLPGWLAFNKLGFAILPYAGSHAYSCTCPEKVLP